MTPFQFFRYLPLAALVACAAPAAEVSGGNVSNLPGAGGSADAPQGSLGGVELCDAESYRGLIGQPVSATSFPVSPKLRIYSNTAVVTQEYLPDRTNIVYDSRTGNILRVFCG